MKIFSTLFFCAITLAVSACLPAGQSNNSAKLYPRPDRAAAFDKHFFAATEFKASQAKSQNFSLWSTLPEDTTRMVLQDLENLRVALIDYYEIADDLPDVVIEILMIDDPEYYDAFAIGHSSVGFYVRSSLGPVIVIDASLIDVNPNDFWSTLYHEYAHHFHATFLPYKTPLWLNEGLAEYAASFRRTENGYGFGHISQDKITRLQANPSDWLDMDALVRELEFYPYIPGYFGEAAAKRTRMFYDQSWLIAMWMRQTEDGQIIQKTLIDHLSRGELPTSDFTDDMQIRLENYAQNFSPIQDDHLLTDSAFPPVTVEIKEIEEAHLITRIGLQISSEGWPTGSVGTSIKLHQEMAKTGDAAPLYAAMRALTYLRLGNIISAREKMIEASTDPLADSSLARLDAVMNINIERNIMPEILHGGIRNAHREHMFETIQMALEQRPGDVDLDILRLAQIGRNANILTDSQETSAQRILDSGHHLRNPVIALDLVYPLISLQEFDQAEEIIARVRLWDSELTPLESNRLDDVLLDIKASRKAFANKDD